MTKYILLHNIKNHVPHSRTLRIEDRPLLVGCGEHPHGSTVANSPATSGIGFPTTCDNHDVDQARIGSKASNTDTQTQSPALWRFPGSCLRGRGRRQASRARLSMRASKLAKVRKYRDQLLDSAPCVQIHVACNSQFLLLGYNEGSSSRLLACCEDGLEKAFRMDQHKRTRSLYSISPN